MVKSSSVHVGKIVWFYLIWFYSRTLQGSFHDERVWDDEGLCKRHDSLDGYLISFLFISWTTFTLGLIKICVRVIIFVRNLSVDADFVFVIVFSFVIRERNVSVRYRRLTSFWIRLFCWQYVCIIMLGFWFTITFWPFYFLCSTFFIKFIAFS